VKKVEIVISETGDRRIVAVMAGRPPRVSILEYDRLLEGTRWIVDPDCRVSLDMAEAAALLGALAKFGGMV